MNARFLFRLDMARDNDRFMHLRRARQVDQVYSGTPLRLGPGWMPDFVEVAVDRPSGTCLLTVVELEATETNARASCRKYLPEPTSEVVRAFVGFLDVVISQCRSTADPRIGAFEELRDCIEHFRVVVHTAGGLRKSADFVEDLPLIGQPVRAPAEIARATAPSREFAFSGDLGLTRAESDGVRRAVRILHAVIIGHDRSGGTLKSWRNHRYKPLDRAITAASSRYPALRALLSSKTAFGLRTDCDRIATELAGLWSEAKGQQIAPACVSQMISTFAPLAITFAEHEPMQNIFARARETVQAAI